MEKRILNVINMSHRSALEAEDDPFVWLVRTIERVSTRFDVLLGGAAVSYAVVRPTGNLGSERSAAVPRASDGTVGALIAANVSVFLVLEDAVLHGVAPVDLIPGVMSIARRALPRLFEDYELVWRW